MVSSLPANAGNADSDIDPGKLSRNQRDAVESLHWAMEHFGSLTTNRYVRRSTVMTLVSLGLAESVGKVAMCDDDGFTVQPERYREGFKLTEAGVEFHTRLMDWYAAQVSK